MILWRWLTVALSNLASPELRDGTGPSVVLNIPDSADDDDCGAAACNAALGERERVDESFYPLKTPSPPTKEMHAKSSLISEDFLSNLC